MMCGIMFMLMVVFVVFDYGIVGLDYLVGGMVVGLCLLEVVFVQLVGYVQYFVNEVQVWYQL